MPLPLSVVVLTFNEQEKSAAAWRASQEWTAGDVRGRFGEHGRHGRDGATHSEPRCRAPVRRSRTPVAVGALGLPLASRLGSGAGCRPVPDRGAPGRYLARRLPAWHGQRSPAGAYLNRRQVFRGRWIRHGGYYPKYLLKVFRRDAVSRRRDGARGSPLRRSGTHGAARRRPDRGQPERGGHRGVDRQAQPLRRSAGEGRGGAASWNGSAPQRACFRLARRAHDVPKRSGAVFRCTSGRSDTSSIGTCCAWVPRRQARLHLSLLQAFWYRLLVDINRDEIRSAARNCTPVHPAPADAGRGLADTPPGQTGRNTGQEATYPR